MLLSGWHFERFLFYAKQSVWPFRKFLGFFDNTNFGSNLQQQHVKPEAAQFQQVRMSHDTQRARFRDV